MGFKRSSEFAFQSVPKGLWYTYKSGSMKGLSMGSEAAVDGNATFFRWIFNTLFISTVTCLQMDTHLHTELAEHQQYQSQDEIKVKSYQNLCYPEASMPHAIRTCVIRKPVCSCYQNLCYPEASMPRAIRICVIRKPLCLMLSKPVLSGSQYASCYQNLCYMEASMPHAIRICVIRKPVCIMLSKPVLSRSQYASCYETCVIWKHTETKYTLPHICSCHASPLQAHRMTAVTARSILFGKLESKSTLTLRHLPARTTRGPS